MNLYEINRALLDCIDEETGEILDFEKLEALSLEKGEKLENITLYVKNLKSDVEAIRAEEKALADRRHSLENKMEGLKRYLSDALNGEKFETARCRVSFRTSHKVDVADEFKNWALENDKRFIRYKEPEVDKSALTDALKRGENIPFAQYVESSSMIIK